MGLGVALPVQRPRALDLSSARDEWLAKLRGSGRASSTVAAYRTALDDLLDFLTQNGSFDARVDEAQIVRHLEAYRRRANPAPATYYRRFTLLRRFFRWLSARSGAWDPFLDLDSPPKPLPAAGWLTQDEFARLLDAALRPPRAVAGLAERDRLVLLTLVVTGLRRSELTALNWGDLELDPAHPSVLVRAGKGGRSRRQPLALALARELAGVRRELEAAADKPVFCGLRGGRLQPTILAGISVARRGAPGSRSA